MIYPQPTQATISQYADYVNCSNLVYPCNCLMANCSKEISYKEWIDNQGYCELHAVELGKRW